MSLYSYCADRITVDILVHFFLTILFAFKRKDCSYILFIPWDGFPSLSFIQRRVQSQSFVSILFKMLILLYKALTHSPAAHSSGLSQTITHFLFFCDSFCETLKLSYLLLLCAG